ncbi:MAG: hypothetical protein C0498_02650 [Anaerolinea sp.]|nr:hypothetical protein [Anaerolinea sp.]
MDDALTREGSDEDGPAPISMILLDDDRFKVINESLGHAAGDRVLLEVARRIRAVRWPADVAARFGGDEFRHPHHPTRGPHPRDDLPPGAGVARTLVRASLWR